MKRITVLIFLSLLFHPKTFGQSKIDSTSSGKSDSAKIRRITQELQYSAQYEYGEDSLLSFLRKNIQYNVPKQNEAPPNMYRVNIKFTVFADGHIGDFKPLTNNGYGMEDEVIRVLKKTTPWKPKLKNGQPIDSYKIQAVNFVVADN